MKTILSLALPLIISQMISTALTLTDVWMMSQISVAVLAAGGLGAAIYSFVVIVTSSMVGVSSNLIAIAQGLRITNPERGEQQIRTVLKGALIMSVVLYLVLLLCFALIPSLLNAAHQSPEVITIAMAYLHTLKWAILPTLLLLVLRGLTSALGGGLSVMLMSAATIALNIPLSYGLAFYLDWGISGLGAGSALAASLALLGYGGWIFRHPIYAQFAPWLNVHEYGLSLLKPLIALGVPMALAAILESVLIYGATLMAGTISIESLALHEVLLLCLSFTWNINFGVSQAGAILVGRHFGAGDIEAIRRVTRQSFCLVSVVSLLLAAAFTAWPGVITRLFGLQAHAGVDMAALLSAAIWVVALCFIVDAWQLLAISLLRAIKVVVLPTLLTAMGYGVIGILAAWSLMQTYGLVGIWGGIGIGLAATGLLLWAGLLVSINPSRIAGSLAEYAAECS
jgi:MATE family multidrug resistance protein